MPTPPRIFAIDWSGDCRNGRRKIWLAEVSRGELIRLENGRSREEIVRLLIEEAMKDARLIVGLDFAFSFPLWFCAKLGVKTAFDVWTQVAKEGERWLHSCSIPFWGRSGTKCPTEGQRFRKTELDCASNGSAARPKSVFQIGGAGAVGTGSIRGMPILKTLREAGFSIWPFDPPGCPTVVEIYPRALTGPVNKSSPDVRRTNLRTNFPQLSKRFVTVASSCEDAFDAAVSALVMHRRIDALVNLSQATDPCELLEGKIWWHVHSMA
ncbi:MAG: hypothetical protein ACREIM_09910 [Nitrospiraceae bacterium]